MENPPHSEPDGAAVLHNWQRCVFQSQSAESTPSQRADALRNIMVQLQGAVAQEIVSEGCASTLMQEYSDSYGQIVDTANEQYGLNNFAEGALAICGERRNESQSWKSSLNVDSIQNMDCFARLKNASRTSSMQILPPHMKHKVLPQSNIQKQTLDTTKSSTICRPKNSNNLFKTTSGCQSGTVQVQENDRCQQNSAVEKSGFYNIFQNQSGSDKGVTNSRYHVPRADDSSDVGCKRKSDYLENGNVNNDPGASRNFSFKTHVDRKSSSIQIQEDGDGDRPSTSRITNFKTAREQLAIDSRKKFGGQNRSNPSGSYQYGTGKKSLGTRRGLNSKFVPPVLNRDNSDSDSGGTLVRKAGPNKGIVDDPDEPIDERLKNIDPKMIELISNEIMDHGPAVSWEDIAGLEFAKKTIKEIVVWPMLRPDIFTGLRGPPKGLLLFGPPGTGKTLIGKCIASQSKSTFFSISASSLTSKWVGEGEKMVRALFAVSRCHAPAVIFIDEIDSLLSQRSDQEHESSRRIKTEFLVQLDGATTNSEDRLLVVGATNRPQELDEAARRRFVKRLYIPLPESLARRQIVLNLMAQQPYNLTEKQMDQISNMSQGYSGADMANLCREAALGPIRSMAFGDIENITADQVRPIVHDDFIAAFEQVRASVSDSDLDLYLDWNKKYGSGGR